VGTGLRSRLDTACAAQGVTPRIAFEATSPLELAQLAGHGLGVAILPTSMARSDPQLHVLRLVPALQGRLVWAWRRDMTNPAARLLRKRATARVPGRG
jgi:DNA-binding transcriptional LysR family regulator